MNAYKVEYTVKHKTMGEADEPLRSYVTHVSATSRENAVYAAFDEIADKGETLAEFGAVFLLADDQQWIKTNEHARA